MKAHHKLIAAILITLLCAGTALAASDSAQDPDISINPVVRQFPVTIIDTNSTPADFTVTNLSSGDLSIGTIDIVGVNADNFVISGENCPVSLVTNSSCTVSVSFKPTGKGTKSALLRVGYGAGKTLTAYLTNNVDAAVEAQQRMPPVLSSVTIPASMTGGGGATISWSLEGYDPTYKSYAVLFDCSGISDDSCGDSYDDPTRFAESAELDPSTTEAGKWTYNGVATKAFTYSWSFTVPATRLGGSAWAASPGTDVVVRFYQKSDIDVARGNDSVSLLIPGNQAVTYYDTAGRRVVTKIIAP